MPLGPLPTVIVLMTVFVPTLITFTEFVAVTYASVPEGLNATSYVAPAAIVLITVFVATLMTLIFPLSLPITYARVPSGVNATPTGPLWTASVFTTVFVAIFITFTEEPIPPL